MAIRQREKTGVGQFVDVAMYDSLAAMCYKSVSDYSTTGVAPSRGGEGWLGTFTTILECGEGYIAVSLWGGDAERWQALWELMGHPEYFQDPRYNYRTPGAKEVKPYLKAALENWLSDKTAWKATQALVKLGFSVGPVQTAKDIHDCPQLAARDAFVEIDVAGRHVKVPAAPVRMSAAEPRRHARGPHLGEHTEEVLQRLLGFTLEQVSALREKGVC